MRVIIAGSRSIADIKHIYAAVAKSGIDHIDTILCGTARGVDLLGKEYGEINDITVEDYPADWDKWGKSAGYRRNEWMAGESDALIAVWDGKSKGTGHMVDIMRGRNLPVTVYLVPEDKR
jgi:hypothetical protein